MSAMAILQQLHFGTRLSGAMLSRKWRVVVFAMAFLSLSSHRCSAGPIKIPKFVICIPGELLSFVPRSFRQPVASPTLPTTLFSSGWSQSKSDCRSSRISVVYADIAESHAGDPPNSTLV